MDGWAQAQGGQLAAGIAQMRRGLADYLSTRARYYTPYFRALLAEAYGQADHTSARPLLLLNVALRQAERTGESWFQAELGQKAQACGKAR
jgi:predicted ATPase